MTFNVRVFCYPGVVPAVQPRQTQISADSVYMLIEPYTQGQKLASNGATPVSFTAVPAGTKLIRVEVDDGNTIRYEVQMGFNSGTNARTAGTASPALSGRDIIPVSDGAILQFVDASAV